MELSGLLRSARTSAFGGWWLNTVLRWMVPFNRPHGFRVEPLKSGGIRVEIPYWRINRNHIRGIHACCLATAAEYCSGLALMEHLDARRYRLIMKELRMVYHYQARTGAHAELVPDPQVIRATVRDVLEVSDAVLYVSEVPLHDRKGNHVATGHITWQVKAWAKVRTPV